MTTMDSVMQEQIEQLAREAGEAGDSEQVRLCRAALSLYRPEFTPMESAEIPAAESALRKCVRAIQSAEAMS